MGFPTILSALQPFQICIYNSKYNKLTFSNGSQLMGKRFMANLHASLERVHAKVEFPRFPPDVRNGGSIIFHHVQAKSELKNFQQDPSWSDGGGQVNHLSTFVAELRNVSFALISFMGFPAILIHYSHFKSAFTIAYIEN